jgi:hypothetical protein
MTLPVRDAMLVENKEILNRQSPVGTRYTKHFSIFKLLEKQQVIELLLVNPTRK